MSRLTIVTMLALLTGGTSLPAQDRPLPPPPAALKDFEWMVGSWKHDAEGVRLEIDCAKATGGYFLTRTFRLKLGSEDELILQQVIGWDPARQQVRSWAFGSDGSFEEAVWTKEGETWEAERVITYADGTKGSAVNYTAPMDKDSFHFKSLERRYGDRILPDIIGIEVDRVK